MNSMPLYYQLLRLEASNENLIKQYKALSKKREIKEELLFEEVETRLELRQAIKMELETCIKENFNSSNGGIMEGVFKEILPYILQSKEKLNSITYKTSWDNCNYRERNNVKMYYEILYTPELPKTITDLLLEQKGQVEGYLLGNPL